jgi:hypothetical protein
MRSPSRISVPASVYRIRLAQAVRRPVRKKHGKVARRNFNPPPPRPPDELSEQETVADCIHDMF